LALGKRGCVSYVPSWGRGIVILVACLEENEGQRQEGGKKAEKYFTAENFTLGISFSALISSNFGLPSPSLPLEDCSDSSPVLLCRATQQIPTSRVLQSGGVLPRETTS
jgi:hypothetical protein